MATAKTVPKFPISIVYKQGMEKNGKTPLLLTGYGSYGMNYIVLIHRLSLLNRGIAIALAHIRGGGEMGRKWYEDGKLLHKKSA